MALNWYGPQRMAELKAKIMRNMSKVCSEMDADIKQSMRETERGPTGHSLPGNPPAVQTSALIGSVKHEITEEPLAVIGKVGSWGIDYAAPLEFGTPTMAPRPWLMPAFERIKDKVEEMLAHD